MEVNKNVKDEIMTIIKNVIMNYDDDIQTNNDDNKTILNYPCNILDDKSKRLILIVGDSYSVDDYHQSESTFSSHEWYLYKKYIVFINFHIEDELAWFISKKDYITLIDQNIEIFDNNDIKILSTTDKFTEKIKLSEQIAKVYEENLIWKDIMYKYIKDYDDNI